MNNKLILTDDELSAIMTALDMSIMSYERYKKVNGGANLDFETRKAIKEMKELRDKLNKEYF
jgi:hypothetical protein